MKPSGQQPEPNIYRISAGSVTVLQFSVSVSGSDRFTPISLQQIPRGQAAELGPTACPQIKKKSRDVGDLPRSSVSRYLAPSDRNIYFLFLYLETVP